jgi:outer membrane receptor for ferrienterochelin and colicin
MTFTIGVSWDHADSELLNEVLDQVNPKFGVVWNLFPRTTIRAGVYRMLKRPLISQQTLEPTQVAGFNQFYDDYDLAESWRYGGAIDQKFTNTLFGGVEISYRKVKVPFLDFTSDLENPPVSKADWDEYLARAYVYWVPHEWVTLRTGYIYERLKRDLEVADGTTESDTHRVPLGINFIHPSGVSAQLGVTYYNQDGDFGGLYTTDLIRHGRESFWLVDAAINYRLPKRSGFITVGGTNIFDKEFMYYDNDINNASINPSRMVYGRVTIAFQ